jgi:hypothetical protein
MRTTRSAERTGRGRRIDERRMSPRLARAPAFRAAAGPRRSESLMTRSAYREAVSAVPSVEPSSMTMSSQIPRPGRFQTGSARPIVAPALRAGTITDRLSGLLDMGGRTGCL